MLNTQLETEERIVYQSLNNALKKRKCGHCFLFGGERNALKLKTAYLLAAAIIAQRESLGDEDDPLYQRIAKHDHLDVFYLDGTKETIKKDSVNALFKAFAQSARESTNKQVYIINNINNASLKVSNMLLKFMEESGQNITGILLSDATAALLPTILSRAQLLKFHAANDRKVAEIYRNNAYPALTAYLLSNIHHEYLETINNEAFTEARKLAYASGDLRHQVESVAVKFYRLYAEKKDSELIKDIIYYYLAIMNVALNDALSQQNSEDEEYTALVNNLKQCEPAVLLKLFTDSLLKTKRSYDRKLLLDELLYEIARTV